MFNNFKIGKIDALLLHRYDFNRYLLFNREGYKMQNQKFRVKIVSGAEDANIYQSNNSNNNNNNINNNNNNNNLKRKNEISLDNLAELVDSFEIFKTKKRLSLQKGAFSLFEYIEESPLLLSNVGMCSKLMKYVYPDRVMAYQKQKYNNNNQMKTEEEILNFKEIIKQKFGNQGMLYFIENEKLPLLG